MVFLVFAAFETGFLSPWKMLVASSIRCGVGSWSWACFSHSSGGHL